MRCLLATLIALGLGALACAPGKPTEPQPEAPAPAAGPIPPAAPAPAPEPAPASAEAPAPAEPAPPDAPCANADACHDEAQRHERRQQPGAAVELYVRACDLGSARSCNRAAELIRDGQGVAADEARARSLFELGCERGSTAACDALGH